MNRSPKRCCFNCAHFNNDPAYLEEVFRGLIVLSSGYASVKRDDGICSVTDRYLSGNNLCNSFQWRDDGICSVTDRYLSGNNLCNSFQWRDMDCS